MFCLHRSAGHRAHHSRAAPRGLTGIALRRREANQASFKSTPPWAESFYEMITAAGLVQRGAANHSQYCVLRSKHAPKSRHRCAAASALTRPVASGLSTQVKRIRWMSRMQHRKIALVTTHSCHDTWNHQWTASNDGLAFGGCGRNRTDVHGFEGRCITTLP